MGVLLLSLWGLFTPIVRGGTLPFARTGASATPQMVSMGTMGAMPKRLPDEFFRASGAVESEDVADGSGPERAPRRFTGTSQRTRDGREFAPPMVLAGVVGALLLGFGLGKVVTAQSSATPPPEPAISSASATPSTMPSPQTTLAPWVGPVEVIPALDATGRCLDGMGDSAEPPANLVDDDASSIWRCTGAGVGETVSFVLPEAEELVGVRLVNGNTSSDDRYLAERRILSVKWEFSDGSWMVQPLAANDRQPQEVRFPPTTVSGPVTMTVLDATVPGETSGQDEDAPVGRNDAVSISSLKFLGVP